MESFQNKHTAIVLLDCTSALKHPAFTDSGKTDIC